jgi:hypothetical protein
MSTNRSIKTQSIEERNALDSKKKSQKPVLKEHKINTCEGFRDK